MKFRIVSLLLMLLLSIVIGLLFSLKFRGLRQIRVTGKVVKTEQRDNFCITTIGSFIAKSEGRCKLKKDQIITIVGKPKWNLIDAIWGKIVLESALFEKKVDLVKGETVSGDKISVFDKVKNYCRVVYQSFLPSNESALLAGIVLGSKDDIGYDFYQKMVKSGTIHIAVASGYNLLLVGGFAISICFWFFARRRATFITIIVMLFYALMSGFEPPAVRAFLMASLLYFSQAIGRKSDSVWLLFLSAWVMLVWDVGLLRSVSFQLSVAASVGLMILAPWVIERFKLWGLEKEVLFFEKFSVLTTICTMAVTTPIIWYHFGRVSIIGLFSNVFVLPLVPPIMVLGAMMLILPGIFVYPTYAILHLLVKLIYFFGS